jgi:hypothetical protein
MFLRRHYNAAKNPCKTRAYLRLSYFESMLPGRVNVAVTAFWLKCDGSVAWLCRKLLERRQKRLLLDTVMQRARLIAEMRIGRWLKIGVCGSCGPAL